MTIGFVLDGGLAALAVAVAAWTIVARATFAAVVGFAAFGLALTLAWVRLEAIDVAMTEAAIGSGLTGALLLVAASRLRTGEAAAGAAERTSPRLRALAALLSATVAAALGAAVLLLPDPAPTLAPLAAENAAATGLGNPVTNVLIAFRAMDTLLEKVVLLLAIVGVWSLAPDRIWGGRPAPLRETHPSDALTLFARLLPPVGIVIGIYILWEGADHPGGAFQGGTILAAMWLLTMMPGLADAPAANSRRLRLALIAGPAVFFAVGLGGLFLGEAFLAYPEAFAKPVILIIEFAMTLTVAVTLGLLLIGPPAREPSS
jgi:multisubunit Na+/H+ antiporter MnhB subunit